MWNISELVIAFIISCATTLLVTPVIIKLAKKWNVVDKPNNRKMHKDLKPSMGGLAIFIGVVAGFLYLQPMHPHLNAFVLCACIMLINGTFDDIFEFKFIYKLADYSVETKI